MSRFMVTALASLVTLGSAPAGSQRTVIFDVAPPGTIVKQQIVYLRGEVMNSKYLAVASRAPLGNAGGASLPAQYQPYLTIYAQSTENSRFQYRRIYQSPGPADALKLLERSVRPAANAPFFPHTDLTLTGAGEFMQPAVQQLVITVHSSAADCGKATTYVLGMGPTSRLAKRASITNACALSAVIRTSARDQQAYLILKGPYYTPSAPLCCPTVARATAVLKWSGNRWTETPNYFKLNQ